MDRQAQQQQRRVRRNRRRAALLGAFAVVIVDRRRRRIRGGIVDVVEVVDAHDRPAPSRQAVRTRPGRLQGGDRDRVHRGRRAAVAAARRRLPTRRGGERQRIHRPRRTRLVAVVGGDRSTRSTRRPVRPPPAGTLPAAVHDAAAAALGGPPTCSAVGRRTRWPPCRPCRPPPCRPRPPRPRTPPRHGRRAASHAPVRPGRGHHRSGRSTTAYVVGGYDGTTYLPDVLATTDGTHFTTVANLAVPGPLPGRGRPRRTASTPSAARPRRRAPPPRPPTPSSGSTRPPTGRASSATSPSRSTGPRPSSSTAPSTWPGARSRGGPTLTTIDAFVPATGKVLNAGLLPQAEAFGGYTTVGSGEAAVGYMVGGEVAAQSGPDQAGVASGTLQHGRSRSDPAPTAGRPARRAPARPTPGTLLIADRGNDRLVALDTSRNLTWQYPSATMPAAAGRLLLPRRRLLHPRGHRDHLQPGGQPHHRGDRLSVGQDPLAVRPPGGARARHPATSTSPTTPTC